MQFKTKTKETDRVRKQVQVALSAELIKRMLMLPDDVDVVSCIAPSADDILTGTVRFVLQGSLLPQVQEGGVPPRADLNQLREAYKNKAEADAKEEKRSINTLEEIKKEAEEGLEEGPIPQRESLM